jgi:hypothetical protein
MTQIESTVLASTIISGILSALLIPPIIWLLISELRRKRLSKFAILLSILAMFQLCQLIFYAAGQYYYLWYITIPRILNPKRLAETYVILASIYNSISVPKWIVYTVYIYYRALSVSTMSEGSSWRGTILNISTASLLVIWTALLVSLYVLEVYVYRYLTERFNPKTARMAADIQTAITYIRSAGGAFLVLTDIYFQYWFIKHLRSIKDLMQSSDTLNGSHVQYYIIAKNCIIATTLSLVSFLFVILRDYAPSTILEIVFDLLSNFFAFLLVNCLILMRYKVLKSLTNSNSA